ncbi:61_t:CDS:2, partial [Ambispora leptoticha]
VSGSATVKLTGFGREKLDGLAKLPQFGPQFGFKKLFSAEGAISHPVEQKQKRLDELSKPGLVKLRLLAGSKALEKGTGAELVERLLILISPFGLVAEYFPIPYPIPPAATAAGVGSVARFCSGRTFSLAGEEAV